MDTNEDLGIMSHVVHLRRTPEFVRGSRTRICFLAIVKFHKMSTNVQEMSKFGRFQCGKWIMDYRIFRLRLTLIVKLIRVDQ